MNLRFIHIFCTLLFLTTVSLSETRVSGNTSGVWDVDGSPYIVTGDITISSDNRLTIESGVEVLFDGDYRITVQGGITAEGSENSPILFSRNGRNITWNSIYIRNARQDNSLAYCIIEYSQNDNGGGLYCRYSAITISNCIFRHNSCSDNGGAAYFEDSDPIVNNCQFYENQAGLNGGGVTFYNSDGEFTRNIVTNNQAVRYSAGGVFISQSSSPLISGNEITINTSSTEWGSGLYVDYYSNPEVIHNLISMNSQGGVYLGLNCRVNVFLNNTVADNGGRCGVLLYSNCTLTAVNCIIYGNSTTSTWIIGSTMNARYCDIENLGDDVRAGQGVIEDNPLFLDADNGDFHLTEDSPCINTGDPESEPDADETRADMGCFAYQHQVIERNISLRSGWNMISFNVEPLIVDIQELMVSLTEGDDPTLIILKDEYARFYLPSEGFNNIPQWVYSQGYKIKLSRDAELNVEGRFIEPERSIDVFEGWQFVAYYPNWEIDAVEGLTSIAGNMLLAKDESGDFYAPSRQFSNMQPLRPGKAYTIGMLDDDVLTYPVEGVRDNRRISATSNYLSHTYYPDQTDNNMSLLISGTGLQTGDEIAAFNSEDIVVGSGIVGDDGRCGIALWGVSSILANETGLQAGGIPRFLLVRDGVEMDVECLNKGESITYRINGFAEAQLIRSESHTLQTFGLDEPHPNPFNNQSGISFFVDRPCEVSLNLYDLNGRQVKTLIKGNLAAGKYIRLLNADGLSSGVYILKLKAGDASSVKKIVLLW